MSMSIYQYHAIRTRVVSAVAELEYCRNRLAEAEADMRSQVSVSKVGGTATVAFGGRVLKCVKNSHNRYRITENKKVIDCDYLGNINDLRLQLATGQMVGPCSRPHRCDE